MREMTAEEILHVMNRAKWGTICTVSPENTPYAIEATPYRDSGDICFMINPRGETSRNLRHNPNVLIKLTLANRDLSFWAGVSCTGTAAFDSDVEAIVRGFRLLGKVVGVDFASVGERHVRNPARSPLLRVSIRKRTGRCSAMPGETLLAFRDPSEPVRFRRRK